MLPDNLLEVCCCLYLSGIAQCYGNGPVYNYSAI